MTIKSLTLTAIITFMASSSIAGEWKTHKTVDEWTGNTNVKVVHQEYLKPNSDLKWPYNNAKAVAIYDCSTETFVFNFAQGLNLSDGNTMDGYSDYLVPFKTDNGMTTGDARSPWGSSILQLYKGISLQIANSTAPEVKFKLNHYGSGERIWTMPLVGFNKEMCNG